VIVAIDAASTELGLALAERDGTPLAEVGWTSAQRQSAELLPRLLEAVEGSGRQLRELAGVGVGTGPGSFTGLRVAMSLAKGLAFALDRAIVGVPSLAAWLEADPETEAAVARAGAREAYVLVRGSDTPLLTDAATVAHRLGGRPVVAPTELAVAFGLRRATGPRGALVIARRAAMRLDADPRGDDVRMLEPMYLRAPRGLEGRPQGEVRWL